MRPPDQPPSKAVFSVRSNLRSLLRQPPQSVAVVDGLRAISILMVLAFHVTLGLSMTANPEEFAVMTSGPLGYVLMQGDLGVDVFLVISGFLVGRMLMEEQAKTGSLSLSSFYLRRSLRLLPAYFVTLGIYAALQMPNVQNMWWNIFYLNNYLPLAEQCMPWAWSLAIEEHFYWTFPLGCLWAYRSKQGPRAAVVALLVVAVALRFHATLKHGLRLPFDLMDVPGSYIPFFDLLYDKTHLRFGALLMGVIVAHARVYTDWFSVLEKRPVLRGCLFLLAFVFIASTLSVPRAWLAGMWIPLGGLAAHPVVNLVYTALYGYVFAAGVALLLVAVLASPRALPSRFLAAKVWYPVAQLSYSAYLLNNIVLEQIFDRHWKPTSTHLVDVLAYLAVGIGCTLAAAVPLYLFVERPFMNLRQLLEKRPARAAETRHPGVTSA